MRNGKTAALLLLLALCLLLSGCRIRLTGTVPQDVPSGTAETAGTDRPGESRAEEPDREADAEPEENGGETTGKTKENPDASRKEYDENAPAEIVAGTDRQVHGPGGGSGTPEADEDAEQTAARLDDAAEETVTQTVAAEEAEQTGVSEEAEQADSAATYYTVLLQDRTETLFECQRLNVYWESPEDHVTVYKTSLPHSLILQAGAYDVSARLLEENLRVDDGWIGRKNPDVVVKAVDRSVLGSGIFSTGEAQQVYAELMAREGWTGLGAVQNGRVLLVSEELLEAPHLQTALALMIARTAYPELFADTDIDRALNMLSEEATGSIPAGTWYYIGQGGT